MARLRPTKIESIFDTNGLTVLDTLATENDAVQVILYSNNSWKYVLNREVAKDSTIFEKYWDTTTLFPYKEVDMSEMPKSVVIDLVDSLTSYHCPYQGSVHPRGKYGPRRRRQHQGVDLPLKTGDPVYATFCGRVRISQYNRGASGNHVVAHCRADLPDGGGIAVLLNKLVDIIHNQLCFVAGSGHKHFLPGSS